MHVKVIQNSIEKIIFDFDFDFDKNRELFVGCIDCYNKIMLLQACVKNMDDIIGLSYPNKCEQADWSSY